MTMDAKDTSELFIPSFFISQKSYQDLNLLIASAELDTSNSLYGQGVYVYLTLDDLEIPMIDVLFITLLSILSPILILSLLWKLIYTKKTEKLDQSILNSFPIVNTKDLEHCQLTCAICLEDFEDFEELRLLPQCKHVFHPDCNLFFIHTKVLIHGLLQKVKHVLFVNSMFSKIQLMRCKHIFIVNTQHEA